MSEEDAEVGELEIIHKRTKAINSDNNIDLILAGRARKQSIELPNEQKYRNQRMQKIVIESENDFTHLLGEVTGEKYDICGRPELELIHIGYSKPPTLLTKPIFIPKHDEEESATATLGPPENISDIKVLFHSAKTFFLFSPKVEDNLLAVMKDYPAYELIVKSSTLKFGDYEFATVDLKFQRLWRRFMREYLYPQLRDDERMDLMEDRLNLYIPYTDDGVIESEPGSSEDEDMGKTKKKRGKRKKAKKKTPGNDVPEPMETPVSTTSKSKKESIAIPAEGPSTSTRIQQRMSTKKGVGLLAKRASASMKVTESIS